MTKEHWWLRDKPFKRVKLSTLYRLGLLFQADIASGKEKIDSSAWFLMWLEKYMEDNTE